MMVKLNQRSLKKIRISITHLIEYVSKVGFIMSLAQILDQYLLSIGVNIVDCGLQYLISLKIEAFKNAICWTCRNDADMRCRRLVNARVMLWDRLIKFDQVLSMNFNLIVFLSH